MGKKLAQSLLLMPVIAAMMFGGGMVQEGRQEMGIDVNPGFFLISDQTSAKDGEGNNFQQICDKIGDEMLIRTHNCPQSYRGF